MYNQYCKLFAITFVPKIGKMFLTVNKQSRLRLHYLLHKKLNQLCDLFIFLILDVMMGDPELPWTLLSSTGHHRFNSAQQT